MTRLTPEEAQSITPSSKRQLHLLVDGVSFNDTLKSQEVELSSKLGAMFATAKVTHYKNRRRQLPFNPDVETIMAESRDPNELEYYWTEWRKATGIPMKPFYDDLIDVQNRIARDAGFPSAVESWNRAYEMEDLERVADDLFERLRPLYEQLHAFVRMKLRAKYGGGQVPESGPIPEHLLGDMHGRNWINIEDIVSPFASSKVRFHAIFEPGTTLKKISKNLVTGSQKCTPS